MADQRDVTKSGDDLLKQDPNVIAKQMEREMNSEENKQGHANMETRGGHNKNSNDSVLESGVNEQVETQFPGAKVSYGSAASGGGDNREIPDEEGGGINPATGRQTKARDFEGVGGPEDKMRTAEAQRPGDDDIQGNVRQAGTTAGTTKRPNPTGGNVQ